MDAHPDHIPQFRGGGWFQQKVVSACFEKSPAPLGRTVAGDRDYGCYSSGAFQFPDPQGEFNPVHSRELTVDKN